MADNPKKTREELAKIKAETKRVEAETEKLNAEAETARHTARLRKMEADKKDQDWRRD